MPELGGWFTEQHAFVHSAFAMKVKKKLHEEQTAYQHIEIFETHSFGNLMVIDGYIMLSAWENFFYHEMMSHPVLYTHPHPENIWIIGGGDCGTLREVLKHNVVKHVLQIDIDERVTRLAEQFFPELCSSNHDPRAEFKYIDGIPWVKQAERGSVDIIIVDSTDPVGPAQGLFAAEFYHACFNCLSDQGVMIQQSDSALYHIKLLTDMRDAMRSAGFPQLQTLFFPQCVYPSGWWSATMAAKCAINTFRAADSTNKGFNTDYYNVDIHRAALAQPEFFKRMLKKC